MLCKAGVEKETTSKQRDNFPFNYICVIQSVRLILFSYFFLDFVNNTLITGSPEKQEMVTMVDALPMEVIQSAKAPLVELSEYIDNN